MTELRISPDLSLPLDAVTETFAIIAKRRVGKSNAAVVMAEQMYDAGIPWVAIDPKGDWWGVRSSRDGKGEGLAVPVFGGLHADVPLEPGAGAYMADLIAERRLTCVLDISQFSKADEIRFLQPLAERLLKVNSEPLHLFFEECDDYIPQEKGADELHVVRAFSRLIRHGGFKGIGSTLITQRAALVSKNVLAQTETLIVFRTTHPPDQKQVADWIKGHEASATVLPTLSSLPVGQAWVLSPGFLGTVEQVTFNRRRTYDSGATPKVGERRTDPTRLADVDLAVIKEAMAETIEKAKADDPKELRRRIAELERQVAERPDVEPERVEIPVLDDATRALVEQVTERWATAHEQAVDVVRTLRDGMAKAATSYSQNCRSEATTSKRIGSHDHAQTPVTGRPSSRVTSAVSTRPAAPTATPGSQRRPAGDGPAGDVTPRQQQILDQLAWFEAVGLAPADRRQLAFFVGLSSRTGNFQNLLSKLSSAGLIDYPKAGHIGLTAAGRSQSMATVDMPATNEALQAAIFDKLTPRLRDVLRNLIAVYPDMLDRNDLANALGLSARTGNFQNLLSKLRTLELIDYPEQGFVAATPLLFLDA